MRVRESLNLRNWIFIGTIVDSLDNCLRSSVTDSFSSSQVFFRAMGSMSLVCIGGDVCCDVLPLQWFCHMFVILVLTGILVSIAEPRKSSQDRFTWKKHDIRISITLWLYSIAMNVVSSLAVSSFLCATNRGRRRRRRKKIKFNEPKLKIAMTFRIWHTLSTAHSHLNWALRMGNACVFFSVLAIVIIQWWLLR